MESMRLSKFSLDSHCDDSFFSFFSGFVCLKTPRRVLNASFPAGGGPREDFITFYPAEKLPAELTVCVFLVVGRRPVHRPPLTCHHEATTVEILRFVTGFL